MTLKDDRIVKPRGFAAISKKGQIELCTAGGVAVSQDKEHMAAIGRKGGTKTAKDREYMVKIAKLGGAASAKARRKK